MADEQGVTDDIVAFIRARLDEDADLVETIRSGGFPAPTWTSAPNDRGTWPILREVDDATPIGYIEDGRWEIKHVTRHDPARVLRAVQAKRRIVGDVGSLPMYCDCEAYGHHEREDLILRLLASEWSDHPEYRSEWKP